MSGRIFPTRTIPRVVTTRNCFAEITAADHAVVRSLFCADSRPISSDSSKNLKEYSTASAEKLLGLPGDEQDNKELCFRDIVLEGKYLNNQRMVEVLVEDAPERIMYLVKYGMKWTCLNGSFGGQTYPWSVSGGPGAGVRIMKILRRAVREHEIQVIPDTMITDTLSVSAYRNPSFLLC